MENEFDFFNNLNFGTDFTKQNLGGYGTFSGEYLDPTVTSPINTTPVLEGIQTAAPIDMIPAPITPFINQGGDNDGGITTIDNSNNLYNKKINDSLLMTSDYQGDLQTAKNDTNVNNLINMGLFKQAEKYVKNNYGYMIMNLMFPGSGFVAKVFVDNKKKKEETERLEALAQIEQARKQKEAQAIIAAAEEAAANKAKVEAYTGQPMSDYRQSRPRSEQNYTGGDTNSNPSTPGAQDSFGNKSGMGRTGYGTGGIVTL